MDRIYKICHAEHAGLALDISLCTWACKDKYYVRVLFSGSVKSVVIWLDRQ